MRSNRAAGETESTRVRLCNETKGKPNALCGTAEVGAEPVADPSRLPAAWLWCPSDLAG